MPPGASEKEIKRAYRRLAKRYHPDRSADPAAHERFVEIAEAYQFLTDPEFGLFGVLSVMNTILLRKSTNVVARQRNYLRSNRLKNDCANVWRPR